MVARRPSTILVVTPWVKQIKEFPHKTLLWPWWMTSGTHANSNRLFDFDLRRKKPRKVRKMTSSDVRSYFCVL
ncbi:hypothetical protein PHET_12068 [Paragonimus heterotremus]|uniref:Uncharacterized protein n=1 Tax=Paragonimus heterotremus TaxID=100268 RepID=A0A8J4T5S2_9TREM|nr:hypothetical protein PHET_12068 [Paragonimus heterotremus]